MYLFHERSPPCLCPPVTLKGLAEQWVEWLGHPIDGVGVCRQHKRSQVGQLLESGGSLRGLGQKVSVVDVLHHPLEHGHWLIDVNLYVYKCTGIGRLNAHTKSMVTDYIHDHDYNVDSVYTYGNQCMYIYTHMQE